MMRIEQHLFTEEAVCGFQMTQKKAPADWPELFESVINA